MFLIYPHAFLTPPLYFSSFVLGQLLGKNCPHGLTPKAGRDIRGTSGIRPTLQWKDRAAFPLNASLGPPAQHPRTHFSKSGKYMHHSTFKILFKGIVSSISAYFLYMQHYKIYLCANLRNARSGNILDDVKTAFEMMVRERSSRGFGRQRTPLFSLFSFAPRQ